MDISLQFLFSDQETAHLRMVYFLSALTLALTIVRLFLLKKDFSSSTSKAADLCYRFLVDLKLIHF
jgi:hypothetical protein